MCGGEDVEAGRGSEAIETLRSCELVSVRPTEMSGLRTIPSGTLLNDTTLAPSLSSMDATNTLPSSPSSVTCSAHASFSLKPESETECRECSVYAVSVRSRIVS